MQEGYKHTRAALQSTFIEILKVSLTKIVYNMYCISIRESNNESGQIRQYQT